MKYLILFLAFNCSLYSQSKYVMHVKGNFFACYKKSTVTKDEVALNLPQYGNYTIKFLGNRKIIGRESLSMFEKNKDSIIAIYENKMYEKGWADSSITYEYYKDRVFSEEYSYVLFYLYYGGFESTLPLGLNGIFVANGIYTVEVYDGNQFIESFYVIVKPNSIKRVDIDYKL